MAECLPTQGRAKGAKMAAKQRPVKSTPVLLPVASFARECRLKNVLPASNRKRQ
jgi:hypothetical protein